MKKTLNHIFDEANAGEIDHLVKQNAAPEVSAATLSSIKDKVYAKTNLKKEKKATKNEWLRFGAIAACLVLIVSVVIVVQMLREDNHNKYKQIPFPQQGGDNLLQFALTEIDTSHMIVKFDEKIRYNVYYSPKKTDYKVVQNLGFAIHDYSINKNGVFGSETCREYTKSVSGRIENMRIDKFGRFIYETGYESTYFEFPYSKEETIDMAKDILVSLGLWNTNYRHWSLGRTISSADGIDTTIERNVTFFAETENGIKINRESITVHINGNGQLRKIVSHIMNYRKKAEVDIVDISEVLSNISDYNGFTVQEQINGKISVHEVRIEYHQFEDDPGNSY